MPLAPGPCWWDSSLPSLPQQCRPSRQQGQRRGHSPPGPVAPSSTDEMCWGPQESPRPRRRARGWPSTGLDVLVGTGCAGGGLAGGSARRRARAAGSSTSPLPGSALPGLPRVGLCLGGPRGPHGPLCRQGRVPLAGRAPGRPARWSCLPGESAPMPQNPTPTGAQQGAALGRWSPGLQGPHRAAPHLPPGQGPLPPGAAFPSLEHPPGRGAEPARGRSPAARSAAASPPLARAEMHFLESAGGSGGAGRGTQPSHCQMGAQRAGSRR